jgi:hypothetical protein
MLAALVGKPSLSTRPGTMRYCALASMAQPPRSASTSSPLRLRRKIRAASRIMCEVATKIICG